MITAERARELYHYNPETGEFRWKSDRYAGRYNNVLTARAGDIAGSRDPRGYIRLLIDGERIWAHRLAWLLVHGRMPRALIDHKDGDKANNRIENLREATKSQNGFNRGPERGNSSGFKGVYWSNQKMKWHAEIRVHGKKKHLGFYDTPEQAADAYAASAEELHGEFAYKIEAMPCRPGLTEVNQ